MKIPSVGWLKHLFLTILEAGKSKIKAASDLVSGEDPFPASEAAVLSLCLHMAEKES